jgi:hypothetical protein
MAGGACAMEGAESPWPSLVTSYILFLIVAVAFCALVKLWGTSNQLWGTSNLVMSSISENLHGQAVHRRLKLLVTSSISGACIDKW